MLYVSTRDQTNTYTAHRTLFEQQASDGGMFVPFRLPAFTQEEILELKLNSFGNNVAKILNIFFSSRLTGWDVDFCCGRCPVSIVSLPHKLLVAELWQNTASSYAYIERALYNKLCADNAPDRISNWAKIAIRIAIFFAVYAISISGEDVAKLDFAIEDSDFIAPMAAWYARRMGLPIGTIICGSYASGSVWDLLHRGELNTASCDQNKGLEQLIYTTFGKKEAASFVSACENRRTYYLSGERLAELNDRIFVAVTSAERIKNVIGSFGRSNNYMFDTSAAISFGALQDYRARIGESKTTIMFSMRDPKN